MADKDDSVKDDSAVSKIQFRLVEIGPEVCECLTCAALVDDIDTHAEWHEAEADEARHG